MNENHLEFRIHNLNQELKRLQQDINRKDEALRKIIKGCDNDKFEYIGLYAIAQEALKGEKK